MNELQRLTTITGEIDSLYHEAAYRLGQSDSSITVLYTLLEMNGECPISEICRLSGMRKQTLNSALRQLEQAGLVALKNTSGRNKVAYLTNAGKRRAAASAGRLRSMEKAAMSCWTADEINKYLELSERFLEHFRKQVLSLPERGGRS